MYTSKQVNSRNYLIKCQECGEGSFSIRPQDKFCSAKCRGINREKKPHRIAQRKRNHKEWREKNRDYLYDYWITNKKHLLQLNYDWRARNKDRSSQIAFKARLKSSWGLTIEQYEELMEKQNYRCAICEKPEEGFKRRLAIDHDHHTGEIRSGLCYSCNRNLIGHHRDPELFRKAAAYLEGPFTGWFVPDKSRRSRKRRRLKQPSTSGY